MLYKTMVRCCTLTILLLVCFSIKGLCQLVADFTMSQASGCFPLAVSFSNTSAQTSPSTVYEWDFGNGNKSKLKDAGAIFDEEKSYTITLTVKDGTTSSTKTKVVTVYKKPSGDFTASLQKGCLPLPVTFTATASAGDGTIKNYLWDFGDGNTQTVSTAALLHTYQAERDPVISLIVTNSYGCQSTVIKRNIVSVLPAVIASFTADKTVLCTLQESATFTNKSIGPGSLSYQWNFGDGTTSTSAQPTHQYQAMGAYNIQLGVTSSEGCTATITQNTMIHAADFKSIIEMPSLICKDASITFSNKSIPTPASSTWEFGDGYTAFTSGSYNTTYHGYNKAGTYTLKLTNQFGACKDVQTKVVEVKESPLLKGFEIAVANPCGAPVLVTFKDTTATAVQWEWTSGYLANLQSNQQAPSTTFLYDYDYSIYLKVTNSEGCAATTSKTLRIQKPVVTIRSSDAAGSGEVLSCGPKPLHFEATSSIPILHIYGVLQTEKQQPMRSRYIHITKQVTTG